MRVLLYVVLISTAIIGCNDQKDGQLSKMFKNNFHYLDDLYNLYAVEIEKAYQENTKKKPSYLIYKEMDTTMNAFLFKFFRTFYQNQNEIDFDSIYREYERVHARIYSLMSDHIKPRDSCYDLSGVESEFIKIQMMRNHIQEISLKVAREQMLNMISTRCYFAPLPEIQVFKLKSTKSTAKFDVSIPFSPYQYEHFISFDTVMHNGRFIDFPFQDSLIFFHRINTDSLIKGNYQINGRVSWAPIRGKLLSRHFKHSFEIK